MLHHIYVSVKFLLHNRSRVHSCLDSVTAKESPRAGGRIRRAIGNDRVEAQDYLPPRRTNFLGSTTHKVNNPRNAPTAANAIIFTTSWPVAQSLWLQYRAGLLHRVFALVNCLLSGGKKKRPGIIPRPACRFFRSFSAARNCKPADCVRQGPYPALLPRGRPERPWWTSAARTWQSR